nr:transposase (putative), gypsy type [Tanacetum cinerariifolium]
MSGWMSFSKRSDNAPVCYIKPTDSLKNWNNHFFWVDDFAFPASFPWHTAKHMNMDPDPTTADFNAQDYTTLVAHPSLFWKFPKAFLCLVGLSRHYTLDEETYPLFFYKNGDEMDIFTFIHTLDPTKVRVVERERNKDEPRLLDTTVGRTVPLLSVTPDRADSELEASVERLFDEGASGTQTEQGDSAKGGLDASIQPVVEAANTVVEDAAPVQARRQGKRKFVVVDAGGVSHPPKKLREDHGTPSVASIGGKSRSALQRLLVGAVLNAEIGVAAIPTLPFVTAFVSTMSERGDGDHTDFVVEPNLRTIKAPPKLLLLLPPRSILLWSLKRNLLSPLYFLLILLQLVEPIPTLVSFQILLAVTIFRVCHEMVDEFAPPKFFASVHGMERDQLFTEFNVGAARQMSLSVEVRMRSEYNVKERRRLKSVVENQGELLKAREEEIEGLKARLLLKEAEAAEAIRLRAEASNFETVEKSLRDETNALRECNVILEKERNALYMKVTELETSVVSKERELIDLNALVTAVTSQDDNLAKRTHELEISSCGLQEKVTVYENYMKQLEKFQDDRMKIVNDKLDNLYTDFVEMAFHLEEKFYPYLLTTISGRRWLLTQGMELAIIKCLNSPEYLFALGAAIGKAIEKGMHDGLSAGITHGKEGRLQYVNFPLLAELRSNKDASKVVMNILRLKGPLADKLGLDELQPNVDQLMVHIHHSPEKVVIGATALLLALDVSNIRVRKIKENIANQISTLHDVFVPLSEPLSAAVLTGTKGTSDVVSATGGATTTLSTTFASASKIAPISVDDYEVIYAEDQAAADGNTTSFLDVDDVELNIVRESRFPSRSLNLYAPFPSAFVTSYGPFHLEPSFPMSSARLALLLRYTRSTFVVLNMGMPIFAGMTASIPYVNENGVSSLLDFIMVRSFYQAIGLQMFNSFKMLADT